MKKIIYCLSAICILSHSFCQPSRHLNRLSAQDEEVIIDSILHFSHINNLLGLSRADGIRPHIRILNLSEYKFKTMGSFYRENKGLNELVVPYYLINSFHVSLNSGEYRDLVITNMELKNSILKVIIACSKFRCQHLEQAFYITVISYKLGSDRLMTLVSSNTTECFYNPPSNYGVKE